MENYDDEEVVVISSTEYVICGVQIEACTCGLPIGHQEEMPHTCYTGECGGQWFGDSTYYVPVTIPFLGLTSPFTYEDYKKGVNK